jgi:hypothetical protein
VQGGGGGGMAPLPKVTVFKPLLSKNCGRKEEVRREERRGERLAAGECQWKPRLPP